MTSDYQSGASVMRQMAVQLVADRVITIYRVKEFRDNLARDLSHLPLPADPASSEGEDAAHAWMLDTVVPGSSMGVTYRNLVIGLEGSERDIAARDAEIATLRAALETAKQEATDKQIYLDRALKPLLSERDYLRQQLEHRDTLDAELVERSRKALGPFAACKLELENDGENAMAITLRTLSDKNLQLAFEVLTEINLRRLRTREGAAHLSPRNIDAESKR